MAAINSTLDGHFLPWHLLYQENEIWSQIRETQLVSSFGTTFIIVLASELGDKTFILTTIMAMKYSKRSVFLGAITAAGLMITLSVLLGLLTAIVPAVLTRYLSISLFTLFGIQMFIEGLSMSSDGGQPEAETELDLEEKEIKDQSSKERRRRRSNSSNLNNNIDQKTDKLKATKELGHKENNNSHNENHSTSSSVWSKLRTGDYLSAVFIKTFSMTFFAEWGDRSQISTILLASRDNVVGVLLGAISGQCVSNSLAVLGGQCIGRLISVRTVTLIGGTLFLVFALSSLLS